MATLTIELGKPDKKGNRAIYIRLTHHREHRRIRMPFVASPSDIDRKGNLSNQIMSLSVSRKFQAMTERLITLGYDANGMAVGQLMSALADDTTAGTTENPQQNDTNTTTAENL